VTALKRSPVKEEQIGECWTFGVSMKAAGRVAPASCPRRARPPFNQGTAVRIRFGVSEIQGCLESDIIHSEA